MDRAFICVDNTSLAAVWDTLGLRDLIDDTSPSLGGNLDVNGFSIISLSNADINLTPNGTGTVVVGTDLDVDNININGNTVSSTNTNGNINLSPNGTGQVVASSPITVGGQQLTHKNAIINGDFKIAQRGTSFTAATTPLNDDDTYLLDRWKLLSDGDDVVDCTIIKIIPFFKLPAQL